jgi:hypothetical protein
MIRKKPTQRRRNGQAVLIFSALLFHLSEGVQLMMLFLKKGYIYLQDM